MKRFKLRLPINDIININVQDILIGHLGYKWGNDSPTQLFNTKSPFLYGDKGGFLFYGNDESIFNLKSEPEIDLESLLSTQEIKPLGEIEDSPPAKREIKVAVKNQSHSKEVQTELFRLGYKWGNENFDTHEKFMHLEAPYLYGTHKGRILVGYSKEKFDESLHTEVSLEVKKELVPVPKKVMFEGVLYNKDEFLKAISDLRGVKVE